jgi:hypothetical protein
MGFELTRNSILDRMRGGGSSLLRNQLDRPSVWVQTPEVIFSSFAFGVIQGRCKNRGGCAPFGLPLDLVAGVALHAAAMLPIGKRHAHHLRAFGDGALASFFVTTGYRVGERWAAGSTLRASLSGIFGDGEAVTGGSTLADQQLAQLAKAGK